jgi:sulfite exporter TauE/SafE/copper chaperone CopZ
MELNQKIKIKGMHCRSCEILLEQELGALKSVTKVKADANRGEADISFSSPVPFSDIERAVKAAGYEIGGSEKLSLISKDGILYKNLAIAAVIVIALYFLANRFGLFKLGFEQKDGGFMVALMTGLIAGFSTCMALVGGLVLGIAARHAEKYPNATAFQKFKPHLFFNLGRIAGFTIFGGLIGAIGSFFQFSNNLYGVLTIIIGIVMILLGLQLIQIFPALSKFSLKLPKSIAKALGFDRKEAEYSGGRAIVLGALTFFLPCGFTQAMQMFAVSTGSFFLGALIMFLFALGTAPGLIGIGGLTSLFKNNKAKIFYAVAGLLVICFGIFNISNASRLIGGISNEKPAQTVVNDNSDVQIVRMTQKRDGYYPDTLNVEAGRKVRWIITSETQITCAASIVVPQYRISKQLKKGENIIEFTPTKAGEIPFSCSMGMFTGKFIVN